MAKKASASRLAKPKRPRDVNQLAHALIEQSTREREEHTVQSADVTDADIKRVMSELGRRGGRIGGKKRLETLTQERRSQIAFKAAQARWKKARKP
jgi:hypothetical protein